jgi:hypothetical protein
MRTVLVSGLLLACLSVAACADANPTSAPVSPAKSANDTALCTNDDLSLDNRPASGGGTAGHTATSVVFTNKSKAPCAARGYPIVTFLIGSGTQEIGTAFTHLPADAPNRIVLQPGQMANFTILSPDTGAAGPDCNPTDVDGFAIRLPRNGSVFYARQAQKACTAKGVGVGQVGPLLPGTPQ